MSSRITGLFLIAAAALFWLSWSLMPGVGVTDPAHIFDLVARQRSLVMLSVITQLLSAALYVPALLGISSSSGRPSGRQVQWGAGLLLLGAIASGIDAVLHLLAYAMTMPGLDRSALLPVMAFMQGPGLLLIAPFIISFFAGSVLLSIALAKVRVVSRASLYMHTISFGLAIVGGFAASHGLVSSRAVGLTVLGLISLAQASLGIELRRVPQSATLNGESHSRATAA